MQSKLSKGILLVLLANIINLIAGVVSNLILPKFLSVDSYAVIKEYQLYLSYVGILHFGYNDAMYLKYGGKKVENIDKDDAVKGISTLRTYMLIVTFIGIIISFFINNRILLFISMVASSTVLLSYYQFLYQACGEFNKYGKLLNIISVGTLAVNVFLVFALRSDNYVLYLSGYVALNIITCIFVEGSFSKSIETKIPYLFFSLERLLSGMKNGILLTLGNFSSTFMTTMDRWFVKALLTTFHFAQYSFAVSMENFLNVLISPITVTLYNYFCVNKTKEAISKTRKCVVLFASVIISSAYVARFLLEVYLTKYIESGKTIVFLFGAQFFYVIVKGIYVNLHKANGELKTYFKHLTAVIVFGFFANFIFYNVFHDNIGFAIGTFCSSVFWLVLCVLYFKDITFKEILFAVIAIPVFISTNMILSPILGFFVYVLITLLLSFVLMRDSVHYLLKIVSSTFKSKILKRH